MRSPRLTLVVVTLIAATVVAGGCVTTSPDPADALLGRGFAEPARRVAHQEAAAHPDDASAWLRYGMALSHDPFGRLMGPGADISGARAVLARAISLGIADPDVEGYAAYTRLWGNDAVLLGEGADVAGAVRGLEHALERSPARPSLKKMAVVGFFEEGRDADVLLRTESAPGEPWAMPWRVAAIARSQSVDGAIDAARSLAGDDAPAALRAAGGTLLAVRAYPQALALLAAARDGGASLDPVSHRALAAGAHLTPFDRQRAPSTGPVGVVQAALAASYEGARDDVAGLFTAGVTRLPRALRADGLPRALGERRFRADLATATWLFHVDTESSVARVVVTGADPAGRAFTSALFTVEQEGAWRIACSDDAPWECGTLALRLLGTGRPAAARALLAWLAAAPDVDVTDASAAGTAAFRALYAAGGDDDAVAFAAGALAVAGPTSSAAGADQALAVVTPLLSSLNDNHARAALAAAVVWQLEHLGRNTEALAVLDSAGGLSSALVEDRLRILCTLGRVDVVDAEVARRLAAVPDDAPALRALRQRACGDLDVEHCRAAERRRHDAHVDEAAAANNLAWSALFTARRADLGEGIALAEALLRTEGAARSPGTLNTLAALYAEVGRVDEAWALEREAVDRREGVVLPQDRYVMGRVYEQLGFRDDAVDAYRQVTPPPAPSVMSAAVAARKRLGALGAP